jgi:hypothetical protein
MISRPTRTKIFLIITFCATFAWESVEAKSKDVISACQSMGNPAKDACLSGGQNNRASVEACKNLMGDADRVACLSGGPKSPEAIKACSRYGSQDKIPCFKGGQDNPTSVEACKNLSTQADREACFLGSPKSKEEIRACGSKGSKEKMICFK